MRGIVLPQNFLRLHISMNNRLILLFAASIPVAAASQVNSAGAPGDLMRGREFVAAADYRAALDRLSPRQEVF